MRRRKVILQVSRQQLAIDGGAPLLPEGPPPWPPADEYVRANLLEAYESGAWGKYTGPYVARLEALIAQRHQVGHALACSSGTIAVELALRGLQIGPGDEVLLAGYDFAGNFRAIEAVGARPVLIDLAENTWAIDPTQIIPALSASTKAIVVSHLHSSVAPLREIMAIARAKGLRVVEDACQAQGATVDGRVAGTWGDVGVWSFGGSKLLTAGRGGAVFTANDDIAQRMKIYCERGNHAFALSELQAAVLLPQLAKLSDRNEQRQANVARLQEELAECICLAAGDNRTHDRPAYYKASWFYHPAKCGDLAREDFVKAAQAEGIAIDAGFRGFTLRPDSRCRKVGALAQSRRATEQTVVLHHPVLLQPPATAQRVGRALAKVATGFSPGGDDD
jgi:dTDP-4-amino-4,6-dideoxygalactose transaminase